MRVEGWIGQGVTTGANKAILGGGACESRAGHSKRPPKESTTVGVHRLNVVSLFSFPQVSGRKVYILNQCAIVGVIFLFRGRYSGQEHRNAPYLLTSSADAGPFSPRRFSGLWMLNKRVVGLPLTQ